jgi:hypothetical protein
LLIDDAGELGHQRTHLRANVFQVGRGHIGRHARGEFAGLGHNLVKTGYGLIILGRECRRLVGRGAVSVQLRQRSLGLRGLFVSERIVRCVLDVYSGGNLLLQGRQLLLGRLRTVKDQSGIAIGGYAHGSGLYEVGAMLSSVLNKPEMVVIKWAEAS